MMYIKFFFLGGIIIMFFFFFGFGGIDETGTASEESARIERKR